MNPIKRDFLKKFKIGTLILYAIGVLRFKRILTLSPRAKAAPPGKKAIIGFRWWNPLTYAFILLLCIVCFVIEFIGLFPEFCKDTHILLREIDSQELYLNTTK